MILVDTVLDQSILTEQYLPVSASVTSFCTKTAFGENGHQILAQLILGAGGREANCHFVFLLSKHIAYL